MRYLSLVVIFSLLLCGVVSAKPDDESVAGLTTGMTIDAVAAKLGPGYHKATTAAIQKGEVINFSNGSEAFNLLTLGGKTVFIEHIQNFPPKGMIGRDELVKALAEKYGPPSLKNDDGSEAWLIVDNQLLSPASLSDQQRACLDYETQGPFVVPAANTSYALIFPHVPVQSQYANCGTVIMARPTISASNPGLVSSLMVSLFDIHASQAWFDAAMSDYNKSLKDEVEAARKNKPNL